MTISKSNSVNPDLEEDRHSIISFRNSDYIQEFVDQDSMFPFVSNSCVILPEHQFNTIERLILMNEGSTARFLSTLHNKRVEQRELDKPIFKELDGSYGFHALACVHNQFLMDSKVLGEQDMEVYILEKELSMQLLDHDDILDTLFLFPRVSTRIISLGGDSTHFWRTSRHEFEHMLVLIHEVFPRK